MEQETVRTTDHFTILYDSFIRNPDISGRAKLVYAVLKSYTSKDRDTAFPGQATLAKSLGMSKRTVIRALDELIELGYIRKQRRRDKHGEPITNLYTVYNRPFGALEENPKFPPVTKVVTNGNLGSDTRKHEVYPVEAYPGEAEPERSDERRPKETPTNQQYHAPTGHYYSPFHYIRVVKKYGERAFEAAARGVALDAASHGHDPGDLAAAAYNKLEKHGAEQIIEWHGEDVSA